MDEVPEVKLCSAANELEVAMIVNLLQENEIPARSDASPASSIFGGLPFEPGHRIYVPSSMAERAWKFLSEHPHFKNVSRAE